MKREHKNIRILNSLCAGVFTILLVLLSTGFIKAENTLVKEAKDAYEKEDYKKAIASYEKIISEGEISASLYYNLGNAYFKNNQLGKAIYNYELASKLGPNDDDIKHNLTIANKRKRDEIEQKENYFAKNIQSGILNTFSTTGWAWVTILAISFASLFFILFKLSSSAKLRRLFFWLGVLSSIKFIVTFGLGYTSLQNANSRSEAIILSSEAKVVSTPTPNGKPVFTLHEGTKVKIMQSNESWTSIALDNGNEGWISTSELGIF